MTTEIYEQKKAELIEEITTAFNGVKRGRGVTLHEAEVIDAYGTKKERMLARLKDHESRWQNVPERHILRKADIICFLDARGFHYYLPAYLVCYLRHMDDRDLDGPDQYTQVEMYLCHRHYHQEGLRLLTTEQNKAVAHFLLFLEQKEQRWKDKDLEEYRADALRSGDTVEEAEALVQGLKNNASWHQPSDYKLALDEFWGQFL